MRTTARRTRHLLPGKLDGNAAGRWNFGRTNFIIRDVDPILAGVVDLQRDTGTGLLGISF